jgi:hypothetical protein
MRRDLAIAVALVAATLAIYAQTLGFEFISLPAPADAAADAPPPCNFDDDKYVTRNPWVQAGLTGEGVRAAFVDAAPFNWSPLVVLSLMLDATLFGVGPAGFHAVNTALHALGAVLVFALLRALTGAVWPSAFAAALFALHPLRVESVAWVTGRKDVLSAVFGLLALIAYTHYARSGSRRAWAAALAGTIAALLAKATWVTLPALFLLLDYWPLRRFGSASPQLAGHALPAAPRARPARLLAEKVPFFAAAAAVLLVTAAYQVGNRVGVDQLGWGDRIVHAVAACAWYLAKTLWPVGLAPHYPHPYLATSGGVPWTSAQFALAALMLAGISALVLRTARRGYPLVGWLWFLGALVPVLGLAQYGTQGTADRYTHLPHIGLFAALAFAGFEMLAPRLGSPRVRSAAVAAGAAVLIALGTVSYVQTRVWRDAASLFAHSLAVIPHNSVMRQGIARCYLGAGRSDEAQRVLEESR